MKNGPKNEKDDAFRTPLPRDFAFFSGSIFPIENDEKQKWVWMPIETEVKSLPNITFTSIWALYSNDCGRIAPTSKKISANALSRDPSEYVYIYIRQTHQKKDKIM